MTAVLRIGTRGSALARAQTALVAGWLTAKDLRVEIVVIATTGDREAGPISPAMGIGVFTRQLEDALREGRIDLAVHSLKDLPTVGSEDLVVAAIPVRVDARDALVSPRGTCLTDLPPGARGGTSSLRRVPAIRRAHARLEPVPLRGNVDTRLAKLAAGELDAIVVARAGLLRLGRDAGHPIAPAEILPAPAQGALALQVRAADAGAIARVVVHDDASARAEVTAERELLRAVEGGCQLPVGALARVAGGTLHLRGNVLAVDGSVELAGEREGSVAQAAEMGQDLGRELVGRGARALLG